MGLYLTPLQKQQLGIEVEEPKAKVKKVYRETGQQIACVTWFDYAWNKYKDNFCAVPNGGKRDKKEAAGLKKQGVRSGWPDCQLMLARKGYHGLFLEGKVDDNDESKNQERIRGALEKAGYCCRVFWSKEEFMDIVNWYLDGKD